MQLFHSSERFSRDNDLQNSAEIIIKSVQAEMKTQENFL